MARYGTEENVTLWWVPTIADIAAPTVAEITAGTDITCEFAEFTPGVTQNNIDTSGYCSRVDSEVVGTVGYSLSIDFYRDDTDDTAWELFSWGLEGHLVWREGVAYDPDATAADKVSVWQAQSGEKQIAATAKNTRRTFTVGFAVQAAELDAVVAA